ncbi:hypothetical protein ACYULU_04040 [Breznakiellaceae bacterium SP9]
MRTRTANQHPRRGLSFRQVWAALMENRDAQQKTDAKIQAVADAQQKTDEQMKRTDAKIESLTENVNRVNKNVGGANNSIGRLTEVLFAAGLWKKFSQYPYQFKDMDYDVPIYDEKREKKTQIDIMLLNGEYVMAVEAKRVLKIGDIDEHLKRMERLIKYPLNYTAGKKHLGAMAAGTAEPGAIEYAHAQGFFVLELTGDSAALVTPPEGFKPRQW